MSDNYQIMRNNKKWDIVKYSGTLGIPFTTSFSKGKEEDADTMCVYQIQRCFITNDKFRSNLTE